MSLFEKVDALNLLNPLSNKHIGHRVSIYADDIMLFATPQQEDTAMIKAILETFGEASWLRANLHKSLLLPICCKEEQKEKVKEDTACKISNFPCKYLGLPPSFVDLQRQTYSLS